MEESKQERPCVPLEADSKSKGLKKKRQTWNSIEEEDRRWQGQERREEERRDEERRGEERRRETRRGEEKRDEERRE